MLLTSLHYTTSGRYPTGGCCDPVLLTYTTKSSLRDRVMPPTMQTIPTLGQQGWPHHKWFYFSTTCSYHRFCDIHAPARTEERRGGLSYGRRLVMAIWFVCTRNGPLAWVLVWPSGHAECGASDITVGAVPVSPSGLQGRHPNQLP